MQAQAKNIDLYWVLRCGLKKISHTWIVHIKRSIYLTIYIDSLSLISACLSSSADKGVADMTAISDIDENGINHNLKVRYKRDQIYVSFFNHQQNECEFI